MYKNTIQDVYKLKIEYYVVSTNAVNICHNFNENYTY